MHVLFLYGYNSNLSEGRVPLAKTAPNPIALNYICDHLNKWKFLVTTLDPATKYFKYF